MRHGQYIAGEWPDSGDLVANINPSNTADVVGEYCQASSADVASAIAAATQAFRQWSRSSPQLRADILDKVGNEILARRAELADLLAREEGKTLAEAGGEVTRAGQIFKYFAGEALRTEGDALASIRLGIDVTVSREPLGVVGIITPWNFPIAIPAWKIAPALAFGNCVVFKPAELVPGSAWALSEIIARSGIPAGVFNLLMGRGAVVGDALVRHADVAAITFTGSSSTGGAILAEATRRSARVQLELGGKNALVVLADADLDLAVRVALDGAFFSTGQRCTASSRLIVESSIHDAFVAALCAQLQRQVVDDARKQGTTIGPVADATQLRKNMEYVSIATAEGGQLVFGGVEVERSTPGHYLLPALLTETRSEHRINQEEVFGPVASVIRVTHYDEALAATNGTPFGLCAGICTTSLKHAQHFQRNADVGMVMVNLPTAGVDYHVPFGGRKASGFGPKEQGRSAREFYTTTKTCYVNGG